MAKGQLLKIEEVAMLIGSSIQTINVWYQFKRKNPESDFAKMLPDYIQDGARQTRYWAKDDVWKLIEFKNAIPHGRNGILGDITQKQYRKKVNEK